VVIFADSDGTLLDTNTANQNGDDGLDTDNAATTFIGNTANNNVDLGIEAVPGVTDASGNKASGNGNAAQCTNVTCT
jgi:parallel beta-helix repeat protein